MHSVRVENVISEPFTKFSGVPQGVDFIYTLHTRCDSYSPKTSCLLHAHDIKLVFACSRTYAALGVWETN